MRNRISLRARIITFWPRRAVVAQTIGSYGLHADYHEPSDDLAHIDFNHMDVVIEALIAPMEWLVNTDFVPEWRKGGKP